MTTATKTPATHSIRLTGDYGDAKEFKINGTFYVVSESAKTDGGWFRNAIGTVMRMQPVDEFPPDDVVALFPGFVGARVNDVDMFEYAGGTPSVKVVDDEIRAVAEIPDEHL